MEAQSEYVPTRCIHVSARVAPTCNAQLALIKQNFCIGAQEEVVGWVDQCSSCPFFTAKLQHSVHGG